VKELLKAFNAWLDDSQQRPVNLRTFSEQMVNRGFSKTRYTGGVYFDGIEKGDEINALFSQG
jgi:hypothetical protein